MTAIFFSKNEKEYSGYEKYARENEFSQGMIYGKKQSDEQLCYFKRIGSDGWIVFCLNMRGDDLLLLKGVERIESGKEQRQKRIWALMRYGLDVVRSIGADENRVMLFWHNGYDIPLGLEKWGNNEITSCEGYEGWELALLSGARDKKFNRIDLDHAIPKECLKDAKTFTEWIIELCQSLREG